LVSKRPEDKKQSKSEKGLDEGAGRSLYAKIKKSQSKSGLALGLETNVFFFKKSQNSQGFSASMISDQSILHFSTVTLNFACTE